jgi:hypothetical protein
MKNLYDLIDAADAELENGNAAVAIQKLDVILLSDGIVTDLAFLRLVEMARFEADSGDAINSATYMSMAKRDLTEKYDFEALIFSPSAMNSGGTRQPRRQCNDPSM